MTIYTAGPVDRNALHSAPTMPTLDAKLNERFGLPSFRPWQREAVDELLEGEGRVLVVAPTGGGKSLCYQFPATELEGTTIVVSPLIALMEDQVRGLEERGISATFLASTLGFEELRERERAMSEGKYQLVYVAPERLGNPHLMQRFEAMRPPLIAIDEAHCISQWGHDFRPDYLRLGKFIEALRPPRVLACTATATPVVRDEIVGRLGILGDMPVILRGFARPNLHLASEELDTSAGRKSAMLRLLREALGDPAAPRGGAIIYAATRKNTEKMADVASDAGFRAAAYHAGLAPERRAEVNRSFAKGELDVVAATNAFGMGIDRPDIRAVIHVQAPGSIEAYYQEVGRAGRDGDPAFGLLLSSSSDLGLRRRLIERSYDPMNRPSAASIDQKWKLFLDLMRYVEAGSCRHDFILRYFGDEQETLGGCGHCDVCERLEATGEDGERGVSEAERMIILKALSGVARARARVGLKNVADMLRGSDTERLRRQGLTELSTFGILAGRSADWIVSLLRRLITADLIAMSSDEFPVVFLTERGASVMKGEGEVRVFPPGDHVGTGKKREKKRRRGAEPVVTSDPALFEALREVRMELARKARVPAYVVCNDRTLAEIASEKPRDAHALADIRGMGPARIEAYGEALLDAVARQC